jgi:hypothetical protein
MPAEAVMSEAAYEAWREDVSDWGDTQAGIIDRACLWLRNAGVVLECRG